MNGYFAENEDIIRIMIDMYPESLMWPCNYNMLPIHYMLEHATEIPESLLQYMIERAPECLLHKGDGCNEYLPIHMMARHLSDLRDNERNNTFNHLDPETRLKHEKKFRWIIKLMLIEGKKFPKLFHGGLFHETYPPCMETTCSILMEYHSMEEIIDLFAPVIDEPGLLLHRSFYEVLPTPGTMLEIMKACQLTLTEFDHVGDTVLHKAIRFICSNRNKEKDMLYNPAKTIRLLTKRIEISYVNHPLKNRNKYTGQLPIHLASSLGLSWSDGFSYIKNTFLPAVAVKDPLSGLYPFLLAASCDSASSGEENYDSSAELTVIFELLKSSPQLIQIINDEDLSVYRPKGRKRMVCSIEDNFIVGIKKMKTFP